MTFRIESFIPLPPRRRDKPLACSFCGAKADTYAKGLCHKCYDRNRRTGSLEYSFNALPTEQKIQLLSKPVQDCLIWEGSCPNGMPKLGNRNVRRLVYEKLHGGQSKLARFNLTCGNDTCINPSHMEAKVPLSDREIREVVARTQEMPKRQAAMMMRSSGLTLKQIGYVLGVTRERARQIVDHPPPFKRKQMEERAAKVAELLTQGLTPAEIGRRLVLNYGSISLILRKYLKIEGECEAEYLSQLKARRDELQAKVDVVMPVIEELKRVKVAIAMFEPRDRSNAAKIVGKEE